MSSQQTGASWTIGTQVQDVGRLIKQHKQMQKMMKKVTAKGGMAKMMRGMGSMFRGSAQALIGRAALATPTVSRRRPATAPGSFGEAARSARQDVSQPNCGVFCNQPRAARIRCFQSNTRVWLAPDELSFG
ncbi:signal recognition particle protein [Pseudomonas aeruginosa PA38182]|nr:signal recognition particle protein [Pseudomonas aeruginosa PA38182]